MQILKDGAQLHVGTMLAILQHRFDMMFGVLHTVPQTSTTTTTTTTTTLMAAIKDRLWLRSGIAYGCDQGSLMDGRRWTDADGRTRMDDHGRVPLIERSNRLPSLKKLEAS